MVLYQLIDLSLFRIHVLLPILKQTEELRVWKQQLILIYLRIFPKYEEQPRTKWVCTIVRNLKGFPIERLSLQNKAGFQKGHAV